MSFYVIIPARYKSTRLSAKLLRTINNKPLIQYSYENAIKSNAYKVIIATDDKRIKSVCEYFGAKVLMTNKNHTSGTSRIAEAITKLNLKDNEIVVNLQGDEPLLPFELINQVADNLKSSKVKVTTLCERIKKYEIFKDPNCVKVVFDKDNYALYFSRATIPCNRDDKNNSLKFGAYKHIGIYAYYAGFIKNYLQLSPSAIENIEKLEQLGILFHGYKIHIDIAKKSSGIGVDTIDDLKKIKGILS